MLDKEKYLIPMDTVDQTKILSQWEWLAGEKNIIIALTKGGDAIIQDKFNNLAFLDTGFAHLTIISDDYHDFGDRNLSVETLEQILQPDIIDHLEEQGIKLSDGQVYSFKTLPIIGGAYDETNMFALDLYKHFNQTGKEQFKIKDLPVEADETDDEDENTK